jgi:hypothetical protein
MPPPGYAGDDARDFVRTHRAELQREIATGSGPRIYDLAIISDCQDVPQLGRRLHVRQGDFFSAGVPERTVPDAEAADRVVRFMQDSRELRCLNLDLSRGNEFSAGRRHIGPRPSLTANRNGTP